MNLMVKNIVKIEEIYIKMKVDELKAELKRRNIEFKKADRKQDLINLLKSNDASK